jgi:acetyl esterase/lipase
MSGIAHTAYVWKEYSMETHTFKTVDGLDLKANVHHDPDAKNAPVIVWIHGGALIGGTRHGPSEEQVKLYRDEGFAVISIDYRLAPETKIAGIIEDIQDAWRWIRSECPDRFGIDPDRMATIGHSAGGYLTLMTGFSVETRPKALIPFYGYGDIDGPWYSKPDPFYCQRPAVTKEEAYRGVSGPPLVDFEDGDARSSFYLYCRQNGLWPNEVTGYDPMSEPEAFDPYCPVRNVTSDYPPTLLLHGNKDTDVPYQLSVNMAAELKRKGVKHELVTIEDGPHGFDGRGLADPVVRDAFDRVKAFLKAHV